MWTMQGRDRAAGSSERGVMNEARLRQLRDLAGNEYYAPKLIQQILDALLEPSERGSEGPVRYKPDVGYTANVSNPCVRCGNSFKGCALCRPSSPASAKADEPINEALCPVCSKPIRFNFVLGWYHVEDSNCSGIRSIPWPHAKAQEPARPKGTCLISGPKHPHTKVNCTRPDTWQPLPPESAK